MSVEFPYAYSGDELAMIVGEPYFLMDLTVAVEAGLAKQTFADSDGTDGYRYRRMASSRWMFRSALSGPSDWQAMKQKAHAIVALRRCGREVV